MTGESDVFQATKAIAYRPQPGDVLFLEYDHQLSMAAVERMTHQFSELMPGVKVVILADGMRVSVAHEGLRSALLEDEGDATNG